MICNCRNEKDCRMRSRGTKDQLLVDKRIMKNCKPRRTNLRMVWIDYCNAYDMIAHSWNIKCLQVFGITRNVKCFLKRSMVGWKTDLKSYWISFGTVGIRRVFFQGSIRYIFVLYMRLRLWYFGKWTWGTNSRKILK